MNVLLLSMPDSFDHMAPGAIRTRTPRVLQSPRTSTRIAIADLILVQRRAGSVIAPTPRRE
jgi:hypothetical protein